MHRSGRRGLTLVLCALVIVVATITSVGGCGHVIESPTPTGNGVSPDLVCNAEPADQMLTSITVTDVSI